MKIQKYLVFTLLFCILTINLGCGKKAPPRPPEEALSLNILAK